MISSVSASPADGPPIPCESIFTLTGSLMILRLCSGTMPIIARALFVGSATVLTFTRTVSVPRRSVTKTMSPGLTPLITALSAARVSVGLRFTSTMMSAG